MNKRILIVDDDLAVLEALKREIRFNNKDLEVEYTINPLYALDLIEEHHFDMVIVDQRMPAITGIEIIRDLKKISPKTKRVLMSAYDDMDLLISNFNDKNIDYYISKPWLRRDIRDIICKIN